jgi:hypothetical protein
MIIEAICDYETTDTSPPPLWINRYPMTDTLVFEPDDLVARPYIHVLTNPLRYAILMEFTNQVFTIESPYKELARHVLSLILLDIDVREHELRALFPELLI